jgi:putative DNA primase/helicase
MPEAAAARTGQDFADAPDDDAIRAAVDSAMPRAKMPSGFMLKADGLYWHDESDPEAVPLRVSSRLDVHAETRDDLGSSWGLLLGWQDRDGRPHQWAMPKAELAGDGTAIRAHLLERGCYISPIPKARTKLLDYLGRVQTDARARAVDKVGWTDGAFVLPGRTIGDTEAHRVIFQGPSALDHNYRTAGDLKLWQDDVARYAVGNSRLAVAMSAAFVGPLFELIGEEGGGLNLRGPSSIGKSTALVAAASAWGSERFVGQWRATSNGLEGIAVQHSETLLCLDELAQLDSKEAGSVAYLLANGTGKARAGRSGALRSPSKWRVMFLSSGEISLGDLAGRDGRGRRSAAGQEVRILDVEADAGRGFGLFENIHDAPNAETLSRWIKEGASRAHGIAGPAFVEQVTHNQENVAQALRQGIGNFVSASVRNGSDGQVARAARRFGLIATAGEMAARFGILPWAPGEAAAAAGVVFARWIEGRGGAGASEDREAVAKVRAFLEAHGGSRFEPCDYEAGDLRIINRAGFWQSVDGLRDYLILPQVWKNEVCAGMDARRVARVLAERGMIECDAAGKFSVLRNLPSLGRVRAYVIKATIFGGDDG